MNPAPRPLRKLVLSPDNRAAAIKRPPAPVVAEITQAEQKQEWRAAAPRAKIETMLRERFPAAFRGPPRPPLATGIHKAILDGAGTDIDRHKLGRSLKWWCSRWDYLDAAAHGEMRGNLDGSPAGVPSEPEQQHAARQLYGTVGR